MIDRAVDLRARTRRAARAGCSARTARRRSATGAPQRAQPWVGSGCRAGAAAGCDESWSVGVIASRWCHGPRSAGATSARRPPRARRRRRSSARGRSPRPRRPRASAPRSRAAPGPTGVSRERLVAQPVALEPDDHPLVLAPPAGRLERLEVERQVRLEVVVEGRPAVADPAGQPRPGRRLATDDDRRRRDPGRDARRRRRAGRTASARVTGPPVHSARMTATASSSRATRSGAVREVDAVGRVLLRRAADADPEDQPAAARDLERRRHPRDDGRDGGSSR